MTTDFRALCAELYREFSSLYGDMSARVDFNNSYEKRADDLCDRARAALAQPEPEVLVVGQEAVLLITPPAKEALEEEAKAAGTLR
jgi:hypothetical protein